MPLDNFTEFIQEQGRALFRAMPWRDDTRPYYVLVSELMLQQTQVERVIPAFERFIARFPDEKTLAAASLADVLTLWQGLGYNRRAKFLHEAARHIVQQGHFPDTRETLVALPGVGENTAGAILTYAFNEVAPFVETNVRTVYLHHFFADRDTVGDTEIRKKLIETINTEHPREFYWALMDYGSFLKRQGVRQHRRSSTYKKQSPLEGSVRQMRGALVRTLTQRSSATVDELERIFEYDARVNSALEGLVTEGLVTRVDNMVYLTK